MTQFFANLVEKLRWIDVIVVYAWIVWTILMILSAYFLYSQDGTFSREVKLVIILIIATWSYPLYTLGFKLIPGLIGNIGYGILAIYIIIQIYPKNKPSAWLLIPIIIWIILATIYVIAQIFAN